MMTKKVYIRTFGCQMNEHDSERVKDLLLQDGFCLSHRPEGADILLFNTCSVRKNAEDRVFGVVNSLKVLKARRPEIIFGILGCMAEAQGKFIFDKMPHVDFLCGPGDLARVPEIIAKVRDGARHVVYIGSHKSKKMPVFLKKRSSESGYVKIMEGCDNFCSYCVVPYVRGRERSRPSKEILEEVKDLIDKGVKKVTLLGQNVNSYGNGLREDIKFPGLLRKIDKWADGRAEIDFVTSHPKDASLDLFNAMAGLRSLSKQLHLPLQSGSNKILRRMNRGYTVEKYKGLVRDFRRIVKDSSIVSDFIVGFPGETKKDFNDTLKAVKEIQFDASYIFKYSARPFTKAARLKDDVSGREKQRRHSLLLKVQREISKRKKASVIFLVGPTASGKTSHSIRLATKMNAEIISCDSMCVYKGMDILTSKPTRLDRKGVKHHLIDIVSPAREFSVAEYRHLALQAINDILGRGKTPLFVGGSGLYVKAIIDGLFPSAKKDLRFRRRQELLATKYGKRYLHKKLERIDPVSAKKIHPNNLRRVVRALEIWHTEKNTLSELKKETNPIGYRIKVFGLNVSRDRLYKDIERRIDGMFRDGIVDEVRRLSRKKLSLTARQALGYREVMEYLKGEYSLEEAKSLLKKNTRRFAKRQMTWFRADKRIQWISSEAKVWL